MRVLFGAFAAAALVSAAAAGPETQQGAMVFRANCGTCHTTAADAGSGLGPNLHGLFGRRAGSLPDFGYSPAMKNANVVWNAATLDKYIADPRAMVPNNRMAFFGLKDAAQRKALITFLKEATK